MEGIHGIGGRSIQDKISRVSDLGSDEDRLGIGAFLPNGEKKWLLVARKNFPVWGYSAKGWSGTFATAARDTSARTS